MAMGSSEEIVWMSATELLEAYRARQLSPVEAMEAFAARIEEINPRINAFVTLTLEAAREAAAESERAWAEERARPLEGVPFAVKDNIFTAGVRTTFGSRLYEDFVPDADAVVVERMKGAGALMLGKTNLPECGLIGITENPLFGKTRNPWDTGRTPGGSSGGSAAAVAAGLCPLALGNDGGGSIRIPASLCGLFGLKPHFGRVPWYPHLPGWDTLAHEGALTRSVEDTALFLEVAAGPDLRDRLCLPASPGRYRQELREGVEGMRVAYSPDLGYAPAVDPEVAEAVREAAFSFADLGCAVEEVEVSITSPEADWVALVLSETVAAFEERLEEWRPLAYPLYLPFLDVAGAFSNRDVCRVQFHRYRLWEEMREVFSRYDVLITPTTAVPAFEIEEPGPGPMGPTAINGVEVGPTGWVPFTLPFNFTGQPAASVPCGFTSSGLPIGMQIAGNLWDEVTVLRAAAAYEAAHPWRSRRPSI
jgi:aspartyl-tRNA(Asn)/glutamyl-tRNA(Gln) amidotransferase subunit A